MEAFDGGSTIQSLDMVPKSYWGVLYAEWMWCSEWHTIFQENDGRRQMTWRNYFSSAGSNAYNFYSSGEDVLKTHPHDDEPGLWCYGGGEYGWCLQEKRKGQSWIPSLGGTTYGGWGLNDYYQGENNPLPTSDDEIAIHPVFDPGGSELAALYAPIGSDQSQAASQFATDHLNFLLAGFVPSRTLPMGANNTPILNTPTDSKNFNMQTPDFQTGWPVGRLDSDMQNRWLHSDLRAVAFMYVYKLYKQFVELEGLQQ